MSALFSKKNREVLLTPLGLNNPVTVQVLGICSALALSLIHIQMCIRDKDRGNRVPARDEQRGRKGEGDVHPVVVTKPEKDVYKRQIKACIYVKELVRFMLYRLEYHDSGVELYNCCYEPAYT